jgi:hypothetical protein
MVSALLFLVSITLMDAGKAMAGSDLCREAARSASAATGVPLDVLNVVSRLETSLGHASSNEAWPWTLNVQGEQIRFPTRQAATEHLNTMLAAGQTGIKAGCFQINLDRHAIAFSSPARSLDPKANALYAARLLLELHREKGAWDLAAGVFHSRSPAAARSYALAFRALHADQEDGGSSGPQDWSLAEAAMASTFVPPAAPLSISSGQPGIPVDQPRAPSSLGSVFDLGGTTYLSATIPGDG